jgi:hypothetical protein
MTTYSRKAAAAALNISDVAVGKRIKSITAKYDCSHLIIDEQNRITEQGIEILALWATDRPACESMIESELLALDPLQSDVCDIEPIAPTGYALAPMQAQSFSIAPVASFDAAAYEMQADSALAQWQALQDEMSARAAQMQANNEQIQAATQAAARNMAAQMLMGMSMELSQQLAAGMPLVQAQALQMMMGKQPAAAATSRSQS